MTSNPGDSCLRCGAPAPAGASACPECGGGLLVDVVLPGPVGDERARYHMAREISDLFPSTLPFSEARRALGTPRPVVARSVPRGIAGTVIAALENAGAPGAFEMPAGASAPGQLPAPGSASAAGGGLGSLAAGAALGAAAVAVVAMLFFGGREGSETAAPQPVPAATAATEADLPPLPPAEPGRVGAGFDARSLAALATPSTAMIRQGASAGTGFFVAGDLLLTNAHVSGAEGGQVEVLLEDGRGLDGVVERAEPAIDLALVRVSGGRAAPLPLGDATRLRAGDRVLFVGGPQGLGFTVHEGIVSHASRQVFGVAYLQLDANVNPGNSGGPVLDATGRVVGVITARVEGADGLGFMLPVNYAYESEPPLLSRPSAPAPDAAGWQDLLAEVAAAERQQADALAAAGRRAMLAGLAQADDGSLYAQILRLSDADPGFETFLFTFHKGRERLCGVSSQVARWQKIAAGSAPPNPQIAEWMERHGLRRDVYLGLAPIDLRECPIEEIPGSDLVLADAEEEMGLIRVR